MGGDDMHGAPREIFEREISLTFAKGMSVLRAFDIDHTHLTLPQIARATGLDDAAREKARVGARHNLRKFYASRAGRQTIEQQFSQIGAWARRQGIAQERIFLGEFGVLRKDGKMPGARCEDRIAWLQDVRETAEKEGFGWAYFSYDGPFAIIIDEKSRKLDPAVLGSLGLSGSAPCD